MPTAGSEPSIVREVFHAYHHTDRLRNKSRFSRKLFSPGSVPARGMQPHENSAGHSSFQEFRSKLPRNISRTFAAEGVGEQ